MYSFSSCRKKCAFCALIGKAAIGKTAIDKIAIGKVVVGKKSRRPWPPLIGSRKIDSLVYFNRIMLDAVIIVPKKYTEAAVLCYHSIFSYCYHFYVGPNRTY